MHNSSKFIQHLLKLALAETCTYCNGTNAEDKLSRCTRCRGTYYCNMTYQCAHWKTHNSECKKEWLIAESLLLQLEVNNHLKLWLGNLKLGK
eukprot:Pgem_evm2s266